MSTIGTPADVEGVLGDCGLPPVRVIRSSKRHKTVSARMSDGVLVVRIPA